MNIDFQAPFALGTAAPLNVGVSANNIVQLTAAAKLPAVDGSLLTNLVGVVTADTGWTANTTAGDKTAQLVAYTNGLNGTMVSALNVVSTGTGDALNTALATIALLVKKVAALETALVAGKIPNA